MKHVLVSFIALLVASLAEVHAADPIAVGSQRELYSLRFVE